MKDLEVIKNELNIHGDISGVSADKLFDEIVRLRTALWEIAGEYDHPCMDAHDAWDVARKALGRAT